LIQPLAQNVGGLLAYIVGMAKTARKSAKRSHARTQTVAKKSAKAKASILSSRLAYKGPAFWVTTDMVQEPSGIRARRDIVRHSGSVVILAVDESQDEPRVLLERQYRHAAGRYLLELPAGRIDEGEAELKAAKRELLEETGYTARSWKRVLYFWASPGFVAESMAIYLARDLTAGVAQPEADEAIELKLVPLSEAVDMVLKGRIRDGKTISGVLWLHAQQHL
jgi:ADP-ribose pyrophosphatase